MPNLRRLLDFHLLGRHRLESIRMIPLGADISDALRLYGEPLERESTEETTEITSYTFAVGLYHKAVILEWKGLVQSVTYWSEKADPIRDLRCMFDRYKDRSAWRVMEEGYWYQRDDGRVRIWCSVAPAIGAAYVDFLAARAEYKNAHGMRRIDSLPDPTWIPNDVVHDLQRRFVQERDEGLLNLATRSDRIAVSRDGRHVLIVRNHHAYDIPGGFMEVNALPKEGQGYSTEVINCFDWSETSSGWGKIALPTDAHVDALRFEGDRCAISISRATGQRLALTASPAEVKRLQALTLKLAPHTDTDLWESLEKAVGSIARG